MWNICEVQIYLVIMSLFFIASSLPHVADYAAQAEQALWHNKRQAKPEINSLFAVCRFSDLFVFAGTNWENPVPESGPKF